MLWNQYTYIFHFLQEKIKLQDIQNELGLKNRSMTHLSDTRWVCRYKNCDVILNNFKAILQVLNEEIEANYYRNVSQAIGKV